MTDVPEYGSQEADEVDWFGGGTTAFDSGEDLAAALFGMAGIAAPLGTQGALDNDEVVDDPFEWGPAGVNRGGAVAAPLPRTAPATQWKADASPTLPTAWPRAMPPAPHTSQPAPPPPPPPPPPTAASASHPTPAGWAVREHGQDAGARLTLGSPGNEYGIRHGVRMLRMAEASMDKLRMDAVDVAWAAAAIAVAQGDGARRGSRRGGR